MEPAQWVAAFRALHDKARRGELSEADRRKYQDHCDELARSVMASQKQTISASLPARRQFSVAQLFSIELKGLYRTTTRELSCQGFTATIGGGASEGELIRFLLTLGRGQESIQGEAKVTAAIRQPSNSTKVVATFSRLDEPSLARIESALFDAALSRLG